MDQSLKCISVQCRGHNRRHEEKKAFELSEYPSSETLSKTDKVKKIWLTTQKEQRDLNTKMTACLIQLYTDQLEEEQK